MPSVVIIGEENQSLSLPLSSMNCRQPTPTIEQHEADHVDRRLHRAPIRGRRSSVHVISDREQPDRHVDVEDPRPRIVVGETAAEDRAEDRRDDDRHRPQREREAFLFVRIVVEQQAQRERDHRTRARALQQPARRRASACSSRGRRASTCATNSSRRDAEASDLAEAATDPARQRLHDRARERVRADRPGAFLRTDRKAAAMYGTDTLTIVMSSTSMNVANATAIVSSASSAPCSGGSAFFGAVSRPLERFGVQRGSAGSRFADDRARPRLRPSRGRSRRRPSRRPASSPARWQHARRSLVRVDLHRCRKTDAQRVLFELPRIERDAHRHALHDLDPVARRVLRRQQRERGAGAGRKADDAAVILDRAAVDIALDRDRLADAHVARAGFP